VSVLEHGDGGRPKNIGGGEICKKGQKKCEEECLEVVAASFCERFVRVERRV
jgi:hypothetical protein